MQHHDIVERVRKRLVEAARQSQTVFYEEFLDNPATYGVVSNAGKRNDLGLVLGEVSEDEVLNGKPPLSAICVRKNEGTPGPEFRRFLDPAGQLNEQQLSSMWQFMREAVFNEWDKRRKRQSR